MLITSFINARKCLRTFSQWVYVAFFALVTLGQASVAGAATKTVVSDPAPLVIGLRDLLELIIPIAASFMLVLAYVLHRRAVERRASELKYRDLYDHSPNMLLSIEINTKRITDCNQTYLFKTGFSRDETIGRSLLDIFCADCAEQLMEACRQFSAAYELHGVELQLRCKNGHKMDVSLNATAVLDKHNAPLFSRLSLHDITDKKLAEAELKIAATVFESQEGMIVTDVNTVILRVNHAFTKITGYSAEETIGQTPRMLSSGKHGKPFYISMWESIATKDSWEGEIWNRRKNGEIYPEHLTITAVRDARGVIINYVATLIDITVSQAIAENIKQQAFYDALTNLPNRRLFKDRLSQAMSASKRNGYYGALIYLDLDNFKPINDTHGHVAGDLLLLEVARRLEDCVREMDTVARLGGDEFVVILPELERDKILSTAQAQIVAEKIRGRLADPYVLKVISHDEPDILVTHRSTASIGVVLFFNQEADQDDLIKWADNAMYQVKSTGGNSIKICEDRSG